MMAFTKTGAGRPCGRPPSITRYERVTMTEMFLGGSTLRQIADHLGCSTSSVWKVTRSVAKENGVTNRISDDVRAECARLVASGVPKVEAARRLGISRSSAMAFTRPTTPGDAIKKYEERDASRSVIAEAVGVTGSRIEQIENELIARLRSRSHRDRVEMRAKAALAELRRRRRDGASIEDQWAAARELDDLIGALDWFDENRGES